MRVLIVEDNLDIQANIAEFLEKDFLLDFAYCGDQGLELALAHEYDVIVLDIMLPGMDGLEVCAEYRRKAPVQAPIIMLTARDTMDDKEAGFGSGADDYLVKPFSLRELKLRIEALARRPKVRAKTGCSYAGLVLELEEGRISLKGRTHTLHDKECSILALLIDAAPSVVSSDSISYALWRDEPPESGALRTHIYNLRRALAAVGAVGMLKTVRGKGYALKGEEG